MNTKSAFTSRINLLQVLSVVVTYLPAIQDNLPEGVKHWIPLVIGVGTVILRHFTIAPVSVKGELRIGG